MLEERLAYPGPATRLLPPAEPDHPRAVFQHPPSLLRKRDGSSGAAGTSASPRPLRGPRTRPVSLLTPMVASAKKPSPGSGPPGEGL
jgi:hypothetical protein